MKENERKEIVEQVKQEMALYSKQVLNSREAAMYLGISLSWLYKLTCYKQIPHSKPGSKRVYFDKSELDAWRLQNRIATNEEIGAMARAHKGGRP